MTTVDLILVAVQLVVNSGILGLLLKLIYDSRREDTRAKQRQFEHDVGDLWKEEKHDD